MPALSSITWTSMKISQFCMDVTEALNYIEMFVKEVKDMKEARVDEVLDSIAMTSLVYLPDEPVSPSQLLQMNVEHKDNVG